MQIQASSVEEYIQSIPEDRQEAIKTIRDTMLKHLPPGYKEGTMWGMICYYVPLEVKPDTYNGQPLCYAAIASQKNYISIYLTNVYSDPETEKWFKAEYAKTGKKLDMGKSCLRFKKLEDIPLDLIGKTVAKTSPQEFIEIYEKIHPSKKK